MRAAASQTESDAVASGTVVRSPPRLNDDLGWRPVALLGCGGTAEVWRVVAADGREAALKVLKRELARHASAAAILRHEYSLLQRVGSPDLVRPLALVEHDGAPGLLLEYLPGGDLVPLIGAPPEQWSSALRSALAAVLSLHGCGLAHGDIKARNVLFALDGSARLIDLTFARPVDSPAARSTAAYSLPVDAQASAREADVFALAALFYELATGHLPYGREGLVRLGEVPAAAEPPAKAGSLVAAITALLEAAGRAPLRLSDLFDVIESVGALGGRRRIQRET